jgi:hypothetical protein
MRWSLLAGGKRHFDYAPLCVRTVPRSFYAWPLRIVSLAEVSVACLRPARVTAAPPGVY